MDFDKATNCKKSTHFYFGFKVDKELKSLNNLQTVTKEQSDKFLEKAGECVEAFFESAKREVTCSV